MKLIETEGYVLDEFVLSRVYPGKDSGLSHYLYKGKYYFGTVQFTRITRQQSVSY